MIVPYSSLKIYSFRKEPNKLEIKVNKKKAKKILIIRDHVMQVFDN